jgi:hypothetical protein
VTKEKRCVEKSENIRPGLITCSGAKFGDSMIM